MTAGLRVFQLRLPVIGEVSVFRAFDEALFPFRLDAGGDAWSMTVGDAARLGRAAGTIARRFRSAVRSGDGVAVGSVFRRRDMAGALIIEIGIVDDASIFVQLFELPQVTLRGEQIDELVDGLLHVGDDARLCGGGNALGLAR